jgi:hypothetical protein
VLVLTVAVISERSVALPLAGMLEGLAVIVTVGADGVV